MGASPYEHLAPWHADPNDALRELQARHFTDNYDLAQLIRQQLETVRDAVRACREDGDEYGLLDFYQAELASLEAIAAQPLPDTTEDQIVLLRKISESSGQGIGNILDVTGVSDTRGVHVARRLRDTEVEQHLGTARPSPAEAARVLHVVADQLGRGESVCFPVYEGGDPCGWWFAGYTID